MDNKQDFNLQLVQSQDEVDKLNKEFYERFNYPWPPASFESYSDRSFGITMLNQDIGNWQQDRMPDNPKIWVAGCGTNQAVYTALKFPQAQVLGTDISSQSIQTCKNSADQIGIQNLMLAEESINYSKYEDEFDYIVCTGVIHHNTDPQKSLRKLSTALKSDGILELMVYNYYHTFLTTAYQKAIRLLCGEGSSINLDLELYFTKQLMTKFPIQNSMAHFLSNFKDSHETELADLLLQPVGHSYTITSVEELIASCNLEFLLPCVNLFDKTENRLFWNLQFDDAEIESAYAALSDVYRWQIANLLMFSDSPMLWFYLQRKDSTHKRKAEREVCEEFLDARFEKYTTTRNVYFRDKEGRYVLLPKPMLYPAPAMPTDDFLRRIYAAVDPAMPMRDVFRQQKVEACFNKVNYARICLTTTTFPYLKAVT